MLFFCLSQESSGEKKEFLFKVLVIGDLGVGKTSIIKRYVHQFFSVHYRATISFLKKSKCYLVKAFLLKLVTSFMSSISCSYSMSACLQFFSSAISSGVEILITQYRKRLSPNTILTR